MRMSVVLLSRHVTHCFSRPKTCAECSFEERQKLPRENVLSTTYGLVTIDFQGVYWITNGCLAMTGTDCRGVGVLCKREITSGLSRTVDSVLMRAELLICRIPKQNGGHRIQQSAFNLFAAAKRVLYCVREAHSLIIRMVSLTSPRQAGIYIPSPRLPPSSYPRQSIPSAQRPMFRLNKCKDERSGDVHNSSGPAQQTFGVLQTLCRHGKCNGRGGANSGGLDIACIYGLEGHSMKMVLSMPLRRRDCRSRVESAGISMPVSRSLASLRGSHEEIERRGGWEGRSWWGRSRMGGWISWYLSMQGIEEYTLAWKTRLLTLRRLPFPVQRRCVCTAGEGLHADSCR